MNFIAPEFLYALGFLAIPILIHLFNFRRYKTVQFSQVRFLKSVKKQTQSTSKLKHLLVLACRCLALSALVFAFAQPYWKDDEMEEAAGKKGVVIYLDNSYSMQARAEVGSLLDEAKNKVVTIVNTYGEADKFQLHTNLFSASEQRWLNKDALLDRLQEVDFSANFRSLDAITNRLSAAENTNNLSLEHYLIGDLQKSSYQTNELQDSVLFYVLPVQSQLIQNVWIKDFNSFQPFHLASMGEQFNLKIEQNENGERDQINGKLFLNNELKNPFIVEMERDSAAKEINFNNPIGKQVFGKVAIKDYPVIFDDTFYFTYPTDRKIKILHLFEDIKNKSVSSLFLEDSLMSFESVTVKQINYSKLRTANFVILENITNLSSGLIDELTTFLKNGGSLLNFPNVLGTSNSANSMLNQFGISGYGSTQNDTLKVQELNINNSLFQEVFEETPKNINYPTVYKSWKITEEQNTVSDKVFAFADGSSFLTKYELNNGIIYLGASNLEEESSSFGKHALFVPTLYNMALESARVINTSYFMDDVKIVLNAVKATESPIKLKKGNYEWIPKQNWKENSVEIFLRNKIVEPGFYDVVQDNQVIENLAFNYNRNESNLETYTESQFIDMAEAKGLQIKVINGSNDSLSASISALGRAESLWKYFIIASLLFIGLEILFLRILK